MTTGKAFKIGGFIIVGTAILGFSYYQMRIFFLASKVSTLDEALADTTQNPIPIIFNDASMNDQVEAEGGDNIESFHDGTNDWLDAVSIDSIIYTGDANSGLYTDVMGNKFDTGSDTLTVNGQDSNVNPDSIIYGSIDESGNFIQD